MNSVIKVAAKMILVMLALTMITGCLDDSSDGSTSSATETETSDTISETDTMDDSGTAVYAIVDDEADTYCESLVLGGHDDWRIPTTKELFSISNFSLGWPYLDTTFFDIAGTSVG